MRKSGVTAVQTLASIIIVLIGAGIILYFLAYLPYKEEISKQACHQSVILRSKSIAGLKPGQALVPLNCKTEKIVIKTTDEERIKREIANAMYDCWWMLGEGKLEFFTPDFAASWGLHKIMSKCVICATIEFDEKVRQKNMEIDIVPYLATTKIPKKNLTYLEYFSETAGASLPTGIKAPTIKTSKKYAIVYMGIKAPELWRPAVKTLGTIVGSAFIFGGLKGAATGGAVGGLVGGFKGVGSLMKFLNPIKSITTQGVMLTEHGPVYLAETTATALSKPSLIGLCALAVTLIAQTGVTAWNQQIAAVHCDGSREGCNMLILTPLDAEHIKNYCSRIESIP